MASFARQVEDLVRDSAQDLFHGGTADCVEKAMKRSPRYQPILAEVRKVPAWAVRPMSSVIVRIVKWSAKRIFRKPLTKDQILVLGTALDGLVQGIIKASQQAPPGPATVTAATQTNPPATAPAIIGGIMTPDQVKAEFLRLIRTKPQAWANWKQILILVRRSQRMADDHEVEFVFDVPDASYLVDLLDTNQPIDEVMDLLLQSGVSVGGGRVSGWTKVEDTVGELLGGIARNPGGILIALAMLIVGVLWLGWTLISGWLPSLNGLGQVLLKKNDIMALLDYGVKAVLPVFLVGFPLSLVVSIVLKWIPGINEEWPKRVVSGPLTFGVSLLTTCGIGGYLMLAGVNDLSTRALIYGSIFMTTLGSVGLFISHHLEAYKKSTFWRGIAIIAIGNIGVVVGIVMILAKKTGAGSWKISTWFTGWENLLAWFPILAAILIMVGLGLVIAKIRHGWILAMVGFSLVFLVLWRGSLPKLKEWMEKSNEDSTTITTPTATVSPPPAASKAGKNPSQKRPRSKMTEGDKKALELLDESDALLK